MDSNSLSSSILFFLFFSIWSIHNVHCKSNIFTIVNFGANSDAKTDSKQAFLDAWKKACATNEGTISIPRGNFLLSDIEFKGPCIGKTNFILNGTIIAPNVPTPNLDFWIRFRDLTSLSIFGTGILNGNGASYWKIKKRTIVTSLKLESVKTVGIRDIRLVDSKSFHLDMHNSQDVTISNIHITAPGDSPNTDGIHVGDSDKVRIYDVNIATGDDCISLGDGATNINITRVNCGPGHGISIGSLGKYPMEKEVRSITVKNCTLTNTTNGLRIKTFGPSTPGVASTITFEGIIVNDVENPIIISQHYCPDSECSGKGQGESSVSISSVKFIDVRGRSSTPIGVKIDCSKSKPCKDIELSGVRLTYKGQSATAICSSADVKFQGPNQIPSRCS